MSVIVNPAGAFGYPTPETPDGGFSTPHTYVAASTIAAGQAVAFTGTLGKIQAQLTNGTLNFFCGVALQAGVAGDTILVSRGGPVTAAKHAGAALTAGNFVGRSVTTAGNFALVTNATAVTQVVDMGNFQGVVLEDAGSSATTVVIAVHPVI